MYLKSMSGKLQCTETVKITKLTAWTGQRISVGDDICSRTQQDSDRDGQGSRFAPDETDR